MSCIFGGGLVMGLVGCVVFEVWWLEASVLVDALVDDAIEDVDVEW